MFRLFKTTGSGGITPPLNSTMENQELQNQSIQDVRGVQDAPGIEVQPAPLVIPAQTPPMAEEPAEPVSEVDAG